MVRRSRSVSRQEQGECQSCKANHENNQLIICEKCHNWSHFSCVGLNEDLSARVKDFYCEDCTRKYNLVITWKESEPNHQQRVLKRDKYFEVEEILDHRIKHFGANVQRTFLVKWRGYSLAQSTWEPEVHMDGCFQTLQAYLRRHNLPYSTITGLVGSVDQEPNEKNWVDLHDVLKVYNIYKDQYFKSSTLPAQIYNGSTDDMDDGIYFVRCMQHCLVVLIFCNTAYAADGLNIMKNDIQAFKMIRSILPKKLCVCYYKQQSKVDFCGSTAILIALEFTRYYLKGRIQHHIVSPRHWKGRIERKLHKYESKNLTGNLVSFRPRLKCIHCERSFQYSKIRNFRSHEHRCPFKTN